MLIKFPLNSQVDLGKPQKMTHVATQGRYNFNVYTKSFKLSYSSDGKDFKVYQEGGLDKVSREMR